MSEHLPPILITRAEPGASETAARVEALGARAIRSPVLHMNMLETASLTSPDTLSGLVFTSANGVRAYVERSDHRALPAWCVGPATAAAAQQAGFEQVRESAGNAVDLARFIAAHSRPETRPLLHVANAAAKGDLRRSLETAGFSVAFAALYEMRPAEALAADAREAMAGGQPVLVFVHSAKGAERFAELCAGLSTHALIAIAISQPAAARLAVLDLKALHIAPEPNEDGLFAALPSAIATLSA